MGLFTWLFTDPNAQPAPVVNSNDLSLDEDVTFTAEDERAMNAQMAELERPEFEKQAAAELDHQQLLAGTKLTSAERKQWIDFRANELVTQHYDFLNLRDAQEKLACGIGFHDWMAEQRALDAINNVEREVRRGNVTANVIDFAKAHPFLTGVIGATVANKIKQR